MKQLSEHFGYKKLLRFTFPSIVMMLISSIYSIVDGFFISNFVGKTPFIAINFIMPFLMILGCTGYLFGTGGAALIGKTMGQGKMEKANEQFSLLIYFSLTCGILLAIFGFFSIRFIASTLGASGQMLEDCVTYGSVVLIAVPAYIQQCQFQCLFATAGKPKLGLRIALISGITNIVLDFLFIVILKWGLVGAAAATAAGQFVGGIIPLIYFSRQNSSLLRLTKAKFDGRAILKIITNGSSELMTNISASIVGMLYNAQLLKYAGEDGVAAYGVLMYVAMLFQAVFYGYIVGTSPIVSYQYGAQNHVELKSLRKKSIAIIFAFSLIMLAVGELLSKPIAMIFVGYDAALMDMTKRAFMIYSFSFLFSGFGIWGASFFTALNDGLVSALIAFLRIMVFQIISVLIFPLFFKVDGIWFSIVAAELLATSVTAFCLIANRKKYCY